MAEVKQKRAAKGSGSLRKIIKEKNGKKYEYWQGQLTIGTDPGTGKQKRKTFTGKSQSEVLKAMQAAANSFNDGNYFEPAKMTVQEWFEIWLSDYMTGVKPLTKRQYESMAESHIFPAIGAVKLSKLTSPQIQKLYNQLAVDGKRQRRKNQKTGEMEIVKTGEPLSAKSIRNIHDILSKALNTAIRQGLLRDNPTQRATLPKVIKKEIQPLTEDQQKAFLAVIKEHDFRFIYTVILFTGLREAEACGLTWDCIDFQKGTMKVYRQLQRDPDDWSNFRFVPLKNSKTRTIKLSSFVIDILRQQRIKQMEQRFEAGELWQGWQNEVERETWHIFTNERGRYLNSSTVYENFKKVAAQIGIPEARLHDLRHTFAVISLQAGDDLKTLQENLGHSSATTTLNVYAHVSEKMKEESAKRQQAYIESLAI